MLMNEADHSSSLPNSRVSKGKISNCCTSICKSKLGPACIQRLQFITVLPFTRPLYIFFTSWCLHKHFISIFSITAASAEQVAVYVFPLLPAGDTVSTLMSGSNLVVMIAPQILRCSKKNMGGKKGHATKDKEWCLRRSQRKRLLLVCIIISNIPRLSGILFALSTDLAYSSLEWASHSVFTKSHCVTGWQNTWARGRETTQICTYCSFQHQMLPLGAVNKCSDIHTYAHNGWYLQVRAPYVKHDIFLEVLRKC